MKVPLLHLRTQHNPLRDEFLRSRGVEVTRLDWVEQVRRNPGCLLINSSANDLSPLTLAWAIHKWKSA